MAYTVPKLEDYSVPALTLAETELINALISERKTVENEEQWKIFRDRWLARKNGILTQVNDLWLKGAPSANKRDAGQIVNRITAKC